ncbi:LytR/AlgR family response regulator transcription factor [Clostridium beijerinckii]|uniref:Stage 0 sporulation protein A homolog n=1 Tax=Clostridium beijerinckii TaxID=1520 RepID=A0A9Q5CID6_CLOBE|nr:LytTR family DNA-binding domain-containing protein [Clostridium beijerinckii]AQS04157.1 transcriptional regulatory protein YpdB [Clostridium beijerinckii]MBA2883954.1 DNA-binding LytR/AlgR family response regulator [Clostridium beijerinckii]MBA2899139.1 DNA-binding LytR/AlgR family response regulator [Clostridium beijerinckii]MBA2908540.1 DNA-binding LytR/AlgR family response regulator [Clostridium beijerinckii]MBA9016292.1 DNA-binding LytR/AlgR family response regulator [Clostridium beijer
MLSIAICDDEQEAIDLISKSLKYVFAQMTIEIKSSCYTNGNQLRKDIFSNKKYDVIFLDVDMPDVDGVSLGVQLRKHQCDSLIVYVSNKEEVVYRSFQASPFRFMRKSKFKEEIYPVVKSILEEKNKELSDFIILKTLEKSVKINPYDIIYVEALKKLQYIYLDNKEYEIKTTFRECIEKLIPYGFIQIHKSYLVNHRYINSINGNSLELDGGQELPISRQRLMNVKNEFQNLIQC